MQATDEMPAGTASSDPLKAAALLSDRQHRAIELIIRGVSRVLVAKAVGVCRSTLYNWLDSPAFQVALAQRRDWVRQDLSDETVAMFRLAISAVVAALEEGDTKTGLAALRLIDLNAVVRSPSGPTSVEQFIDIQTDQKSRSAERSLRSELAMSTMGSVMDEFGTGPDSIRAETIDAFRRRAEADLATELAASSTARCPNEAASVDEADPGMTDVGSIDGANSVSPDRTDDSTPTDPDPVDPDRLFPVDRLPARSTSPRHTQKPVTGRTAHAAP